MGLFSSGIQPKCPYGLWAWGEAVSIMGNRAWHVVTSAPKRSPLRLFCCQVSSIIIIIIASGMAHYRVGLLGLNKTISVKHAAHSSRSINDM